MAVRALFREMCKTRLQIFGTYSCHLPAITAGLKTPAYFPLINHQLLSPVSPAQSMVFGNRCCSTTSEETEDKANKKEKYDPVDVHTSIQYMDSEAYQFTYGERPVWYHYRPNHAKARPRRITRKTCVRKGVISTGNPCPVCRDNHVVMDYRNVKLLKQFLAPDEKTIYKPARTQICMTQHKKFLVAFEKAKEAGLLEDKTLEFRRYNYNDYYNSLQPKDARKKSAGNSVTEQILRELTITE